MPWKRPGVRLSMRRAIGEFKILHALGLAPRLPTRGACRKHAFSAIHAFAIQRSRRNDIAPGWKNVFRIINQVVPITTFAGPGGWNDLDMLEVGNVGAGLTIPEQQTHVGIFHCVIGAVAIPYADLQSY